MPKAADLILAVARVLLYGPPGSGKTCFLGTLGEILEIYDLDGNASSLATLKDKFYDTRRKVEVVSNLQYDEPGKFFAFQNLKNRLLTIAKEIKAGTYPYKALGIDSLTTLMQMAKAQVLQTHRDKNQFHDLTLSMAQYQVMFNEVGSLIRILNSLPIFTCLIAHEQTNETDQVQSHEIMIPGKSFPSEVRSMFPEILYCRLKPAVAGSPAGSKSSFSLQTVRSWDATARSCLNIPDGTDMNLGLPEILKRAGVEL